MSQFRITASAITHTGHVRSTNEDSVVELPELSLWAVADGMGGLSHGSWASHQIVVVLNGLQLTAEFDDDVRRIGDAIHQANTRIVDASLAHGTQMGTTAVVLHIVDSRFAILWAGDSRAYLQRRHALYRLSRDHTQVQEMVDAGVLSPADAAHHPAAHVLSRAVGVEQVLKLEAIADTIEPHDVFLLCSDGLTGVVTDAEIADRLDHLKPDVAARRLLDLALSRGAPDNVSIIAVGCEEKTRLDLPMGEVVHA